MLGRKGWQTGKQVNWKTWGDRSSRVPDVWTQRLRLVKPSTGKQATRPLLRCEHRMREGGRTTGRRSRKVTDGEHRPRGRFWLLPLLPDTLPLLPGKPLLAPDIDRTHSDHPLLPAGCFTQREGPAPPLPRRRQHTAKHHWLLVRMKTAVCSHFQMLLTLQTTPLLFPNVSHLPGSAFSKGFIIACRSVSPRQGRRTRRLPGILGQDTDVPHSIPHLGYSCSIVPEAMWRRDRKGQGRHAACSSRLEVTYQHIIPSVLRTMTTKLPAAVLRPKGEHGLTTVCLIKSFPSLRKRDRGFDQ